MRYIAKPVTCTARRIVDVAITLSSRGPSVELELEGGELFRPDAGMLARIPAPSIGDYVVTQEDGYTYLNPQAVFERKYRRAPRMGEDAAVIALEDAVAQLRGEKTTKENALALTHAETAIMWRQRGNGMLAKPAAVQERAGE